MKMPVRIDAQPAWDALCPEWKLVPGPAPHEVLQIDCGGKPDYAPGEEIVFRVLFLRDGKPCAGEEITLMLQRDFEAPLQFARRSAAAPLEVRTSLRAPGFARLSAVCGTAAAAWGAACEPEKIKAAPEVEGFDAFWEEQKDRLAAVPMQELRCEAVPPDDPAYADVVCCDVQVSCAGNAPVSGMLAMKKGAKPHSLPGYLFFHGAGVRPAFQPLTWAQDGFLAFNVNAHGLPNRAGNAFFAEQRDVLLKNYEARHYVRPEDSLFCDMTLRVLRAIAYLKSRPEWDGRTLILHGGSQGGYQVLAGAALDHDVTFAVANAPAMCNLAGSLEGRTASWPMTVKPGVSAAEVRSSCFCDGAAFARRIACETVFTYGYSDCAAVPSSVCAAANGCPAPHLLVPFYDLGHERSVFWTGTQEIREFARVPGVSI